MARSRSHFLPAPPGIVGSTGTVLFIVHFLTPIEQGYYYTLLSLVSLQARFRTRLFLCNSATGGA